MKIADLKADATTDALVAMAQGWEWHESNGEGIDCWFKRGAKPWTLAMQNYHPTTNPAQWAELVGEFKVSVKWMYCDKRWEACTDRNQPEATLIWGVGLTPALAICKAVIASVWGDEIPDAIWEKVNA